MNKKQEIKSLKIASCNCFDSRAKLSFYPPCKVMVRYTPASKELLDIAIYREKTGKIFKNRIKTKPVEKFVEIKYCPICGKEILTTSDVKGYAKQKGLKVSL